MLSLDHQTQIILSLGFVVQRKMSDVIHPVHHQPIVGVCELVYNAFLPEENVTLLVKKRCFGSFTCLRESMCAPFYLPHLVAVR